MKCPGQDSRYWKQGAIFEAKCPKCGHEVEFFKDDTTRRCKNCGHRFLNPKLDFGCASYCQYAEQCLGNLPPELLAEKDDLLKNRVAIEMKRYFGQDFKRIGHAANVARYAEQIVNEEKGNPAVVLCAAYLHDIGIHEAERKYNSTAARYQEKEGPPIARGILTKLGAREALIDEVCDIIGHHHPRDKETINFKILYDADLIVNLEERQKEKEIERDRLSKIIEKTCLTDTGKRLARKVLLGAKNESDQKDH
ncbi:MAG: HD domain-containing protein [Deltaproteobacteria bacterium]|nr:HD domain-containing protein [Deltaproteobacteria bacterium]MBW2073756.1 HD domain-containing protein [Deltaproteobacteria bacterium]